MGHIAADNVCKDVCCMYPAWASNEMSELTWIQRMTQCTAKSMDSGSLILPPSHFKPVQTFFTCVI